MTWLLPSSYEATSIECFSTTAGGTFAGVYVPVLLPGTTSPSETSTPPGVPFNALPTRAPEAADGGFVGGAILAGVSVLTVCVVISWQAYQGNVPIKVVRPDISWIECFKQKQTAPFEEKETKLDPSTASAASAPKPKQAWAEKEEEVTWLRSTLIPVVLNSPYATSMLLLFFVGAPVKLSKLSRLPVCHNHFQVSIVWVPVSLWGFSLMSMVFSCSTMFSLWSSRTRCDRCRKRSGNRMSWDLNETIREGFFIRWDDEGLWEKVRPTRQFRWVLED